MTSITNIKLLLSFGINPRTFITGCVKNSPLNAPQPLPAADNPLPAVALPAAHPLFAAGAGYVIPNRSHRRYKDAISQSLPSNAEMLYLASLDTRLFPVEDVFTTGWCARRVGLHPPRHDARFSCGEVVARDCDMAKRFTGHKVTPQRQFKIVEAVEGGLC